MTQNGSAQKCCIFGCGKDADYEIEYITDPPHGISFCVCAEHQLTEMPEVGSYDNIKKISQNSKENEVRE